MSALPGDRIVCFNDTTICDGKGQHDITLWTDGIVAYANSGLTGADCPLVRRDTTQVQVTCAHPTFPDEEPCGGMAYFSLTDECWTTDAPTVGMLNSYGERIDQ